MRALHTDHVPSSLPLVPSSQLIGHEGPVQSLRFTADGKYCVTGGHDRTVRLWNPFRYDPAANHNNDKTTIQATIPPPPAMPIQSYTSGYTHPITAVLASDTWTASQVLLAASQRTLVVSDLITQQCKRRLQGHHVGTINQIAVARHAEAYLTASYDGTVAIWDGRSSDYKPLQVLKEAKDSVTDVQVVHQASNNDQTTAEAYIRTGSIDGVLRTYDLRRGMVQADDCGSPITSFAATKDGQCVAVSCLDGTIRLIQVDNSGELLNTYSGHKAGNYGLQVGILANDETIVSASEDGVCVLSDLVQAHRVQALEVSPGTPVCSIAVHPKLSSVVITASYNGTTTVWSHDSTPFYSD
jgi:mitogen-activated protein kinase organizer 1